jgi:hypothetical protein
MREVSVDLRELKVMIDLYRAATPEARRRADHLLPALAELAHPDGEAINTVSTAFDTITWFRLDSGKNVKVKINSRGDWLEVLRPDEVPMSDAESYEVGCKVRIFLDGR